MSLRVHFLNVGRGDCTIIEFPSGRVAMVDVCNLSALDPDTEREYRELAQAMAEQESLRAGYGIGLLAELRKMGRSRELADKLLAEARERLTNPLDYYLRFIGKQRPIFRLLITHPDMDHMSGLHRLYYQSGIEILNFWHTGPHDFNLARTTECEWEQSPYDKRDWEAYKRLRASSSGPKSLVNLRGAQGDFWTEDGVEILAPSQELIELAAQRDQPNILSMVLKISYRGKAILLGGDATAEETWPDILAHDPVLDDVWVYKASHHGRKTGYYGPAVKLMAPWLTITSVTEREHDATENYRRYSSYTVSLRDAGSFSVEIGDDGTLYYPPSVLRFAKPKRDD